MHFNLKEKRNRYVVTTKKVLPLNLNKRYDVYFYEKNIILPPYSVSDKYKMILEEIKSKKEINIDNETFEKELQNIINVLNSIGKSLYMDESIIKLVNEKSKIQFVFSKVLEQYICNVSFDYGDMCYKYDEAVKIDTYRKNCEKIEMALNKYRFFYKNGEFVFLGNDDEFYNFLKRGISELLTYGSVNIDKCSDYYKFKDISFESFNIEKYKDKYKADINGINDDELTEILQKYNEGALYAKLNDNHIIDFSSENNKKLLDTLNNINMKNGLINLSDIMYISEKVSKESQLKELKKSLKEACKDNVELDDELPHNLNCTLKEYQKEGFKWFKRLASLKLGGILADEMGLGKTVQTIAFLLSESSSNKKSLILMPASLLYNWKNEIEKFAPSLKIGCVYGDKKQREKVIEDYEDFNILLTTYGTLTNDIELYNTVSFDYMILDEGQFVNNYKTVIAQNIRKIKSTSRFVLSGTPIENNFTELWSLFDFIMPGLLGDVKEFKEKINRDDNRFINELKIMISPFILKRNKENVIHIPDKNEYILYLDMKEGQKEAYENLQNEIRNKITQEHEEASYINLLSYLTKLRQMCLDPSLINEAYNKDNIKEEKCLELINENIKSHKIIVFSQYTTILKKLAQIFDDKGFGYYYLDGATSPKERIRRVNEFNENEEKCIFLISLKAGGTGLNLTGADMVIHFDPWYNPAVENQATDRSHRIGQKNHVTVYKLILNETIEERIIMLQDKKKNMIKDILDNDSLSEQYKNDWNLQKEEIINIILR